MIIPSDQGPIFPHMITCAAAAEHVAGLVQATKEVGDQWKNLSSTDQSALLTEWEKAFQNHASEAAPKIITSIANHPLLSHLWHGLAQESHELIAAHIKTLAQTTLQQVIITSSEP